MNEKRYVQTAEEKKQAREEAEQARLQRIKEAMSAPAEACDARAIAESYTDLSYLSVSPLPVLLTDEEKAERKRLQALKWHTENPEKHLKHQRTYYARHREKIRAKQNASYVKKEKVPPTPEELEARRLKKIERSREYRKNNPDASKRHAQAFYQRKKLAKAAAEE